MTISGSGVVAELLEHAHPVRDAPMLDHPSVGEPGNVDDVDADLLGRPGGRGARPRGSAEAKLRVPPFGPSRSPST